jgi:hypothetical protein
MKGECRSSQLAQLSKPAPGIFNRFMFRTDNQRLSGAIGSLILLLRRRPFGERLLVAPRGEFGRGLGCESFAGR